MVFFSSKEIGLNPTYFGLNQNNKILWKLRYALTRTPTYLPDQFSIKNKGSIFSIAYPAFDFNYSNEKLFFVDFLSRIKGVAPYDCSKMLYSFQ